MKSSKLQSVLATAFAVLTCGVASAQIPAGYYDSLKGKKGAELKTAVHNIVKNAKVLEYGSGSGKTWEGFYTTDNDNGYVVDRYSNEKRKFGSKGSVVSGMNIEHSFPKSWWGGSSTQAYKDLFNLMPSDSKANSSKSNYGMGEVTNATYDNGCIKVGSGAGGFKLWEPSAHWKGDFSRGYMYMATAYQDYNYSNNEAKNSLTTGAYPTLKEWAYKLYIKWAKEDRPDEMEIKRNEEVYKIQGNRNPYIDFPNLMEYVWGDSVDYAFDPTTTMKSSDYQSGGDNPDTPGPDEPTDGIVYTANYKTGDGRCTVKDITVPSGGTYVWTRTTQYGWKASGHIGGKNGANYDSEGCLLLPEIDLAGYTGATLSFSHALNFCTEAEKYVSVEVTCDGKTTKLQGVNWPIGTNYTFVGSGDIDLGEFAGKKIQIAFRYTSDTAIAGTWEIANATVMGKKAVNCIPVVILDVTRPYEMYDISGHRLDTEDEHNGMVIIRQGNNTWKTVKKSR